MATGLSILPPSFLWFEPFGLAASESWGSEYERASGHEQGKKSPVGAAGSQKQGSNLNKSSATAQCPTSIQADSGPYLCSGWDLNLCPGRDLASKGEDPGRQTHADE